ncbi:MAG: hypothetical protein KJZ69_00905 [Phycisphaerales bacterium]|nr:hypothetical protein [Phycisphaerales bacterium]
MAFIQSDHHSVDDAGYKAVTPAARCALATGATSIPGSTTMPLRHAIVRKRSRLLLRHHTGPGDALFIGGDGVTTAQGYPLALGQLLDLPVNPGVIVVGATGAQISNTGIRTLEAG